MPAWIPLPEWKDQAAFLIGGGASLRGFDFRILEGRNVIGCNDAFRLGPAVVSICLFGDTSWWERNKHDLKNFTGRVVTCAPTCCTFKLDWLLQMKRIRDGLHEGDTLGWNSSTGAAAINLAVSLGATRIYLLGYDLDTKNGKFHWHDFNTKRLSQEPFVRFTRGFHVLAKSLQRLPEVRVFNVTDGFSKLPVFERITMSTFLSTLALPRVLARSAAAALSPADSGCLPRQGHSIDV